jgi:hypothetical protein
LQCSPSSRLISSLLKQSPGIRPPFFNQKMAQKAGWAIAKRWLHRLNFGLLAV